MYKVCLAVYEMLEPVRGGDRYPFFTIIDELYEIMPNKTQGRLGASGICVNLKYISNNFGYTYYTLVDMIQDLPELLKYKPKKVQPYDYWFSTGEERIKVLKKIITKLEKEI